MEHKVTLIVMIKVHGSLTQSVTMEKPYWVKTPGAENARKAVLDLRHMGLCEGKIYKVVKSDLDNFFVGVY